MFGPGDFDGMIQEAIKMRDFEHPNVLGLIGVSIDVHVGGSPYIVMPFMANGSLLSYLKKERANLTIAEGASEDLVGTYCIATNCRGAKPLQIGIREYFCKTNSADNKACTHVSTNMAKFCQHNFHS